jgi:two-component system response regulator AtoC
MALGTSSIDPLPPLNVIFGKSASMRGIREQLERISAANLPVLIHGESGTGKDVLARLFHKLSPWASGPFVKINCPAIPASLMESELFGYERGAFTGANTAKPGRVEMAHRGTLFLDEISELDLGLQSKLLQLLQDGQFCRIGAHEDKKVEVRVVCATNRKLEQETSGLICSTASTCSMCTWRLCASVPRTSPSWWTISSRSTTTNTTCARARSALR